MTNDTSGNKNQRVIHRLARSKFGEHYIYSVIFNDYIVAVTCRFAHVTL